jgi:glycosyltransferase involved in cell wall biosynthesis
MDEYDANAGGSGRAVAQASPIKSDILLSVVVPMYNEQGNIRPLVEELTGSLNPLTDQYEIILVDDGSRDQTWKQICESAAQDESVKGIKLTRNFGHQNALIAGMQLARGQAIVSMDGDLQHPPELIPLLFAAWQDGFKVVATKRIDTESSGFFKRLTSRAFYKVFSNLAEISMVEGRSDFRLIDRQVLDEVMTFKGTNPFLRGTIEWLGFPSKTIEFKIRERHAGQSKYNLAKMLRFAGSAIVSFSTKPLKLGIWLGIFTAALALLELVYILIQYSRGVTIPGWASTVGILSFLFGVLFVILGIMGIYIAKIHETLQMQPTYVVDELINFRQ